MKTRTRAVAAIFAALCLALAVTAIPSTTVARERSDTTSTATSTSVRETILGSSAERPVSEMPVRYDESIIKWIPIGVPLFAVLLAIGAYLILGMVL